MQAALARAYALAGKQEAAITLLHQLEKLSAERYVAPFEFALVHFALGHSGVGYRWLSKACKDRCFELISIKLDPIFDPLRSDPRFAGIARQVGVD
jgi:serine/threonine-protein kinase